MTIKNVIKLIYKAYRTSSSSMIQKNTFFGVYAIFALVDFFLDTLNFLFSKESFESVVANAQVNPNHTPNVNSMADNMPVDFEEIRKKTHACKASIREKKQMIIECMKKLQSLHSEKFARVRGPAEFMLTKERLVEVNAEIDFYLKKKMNLFRELNDLSDNLRSVKAEARACLSVDDIWVRAAIGLATFVSLAVVIALLV
jgi:hypothetical protein